MNERNSPANLAMTQSGTIGASAADQHICVGTPPATTDEHGLNMKRV